jgi:hypothetical protein
MPEEQQQELRTQQEQQELGQPQGSQQDLQSTSVDGASVASVPMIAHQNTTIFRGLRVSSLLKS